MYQVWRITRVGVSCISLILSVTIASADGRTATRSAPRKTQQLARGDEARISETPPSPKADQETSGAVHPTEFSLSLDMELEVGGELSCFQGRELCPGLVPNTAGCGPIHPGGDGFARMTVDAAVAYPFEPLDATIDFDTYRDSGGIKQTSDLRNALFLFRATVWDDNESGLGGFEARFKIWIIPSFPGELVTISSNSDGQLEGRQPPGTRSLQLHGPFKKTGCEWGDTGTTGLKPQDIEYENFLLWDWDWTVDGRQASAISIFTYESDECAGPFCNNDDWIAWMFVERNETRLRPVVISDETVSENVLAQLANLPEADSDGGTIDIEYTLGTPNTPPDARLEVPEEVECSLPTGAAVVSLDASQTTDVDGDVLEYVLKVGGHKLFARDPEKIVDGLVPLGQSGVQLTATDFTGFPAVAFDSIRVIDTIPPVVEAPPDIALECAQPGSIALDIGKAFVTDQCSANLIPVADGPSIFGLGTTEVSHIAVDASGNVGQDIQRVRIEDTIAPKLEVDLETQTLWPPNGAMVSVEATVEVSDACDADPVVTLASIEVFDVERNGDLVPVLEAGDWLIEGLDALLRATKGKRGLGRQYLLKYVTSDASGNTTEIAKLVTVPESISRLKSH